VNNKIEWWRILGKKIMEITINNKTANVTDKDICRFWSKVSFKPGLGPNGDCWEWRGCLGDSGYGTFSFRRISKCLVAHKFSAVLYYKEIPNGMLCCHTCDNVKCVRPDHIFLGTNSDNMKDMSRKGRGRKYGSKGEDAPSNKLKWFQVKEIRRLYLDGMDMTSIGKIYNISKSNSRNICLNLTWIDNNYTPRNPDYDKRKYKEDEINKIIQLRRDGIQIKEIAKKLQIPKDSVVEILKRAGVKKTK